ncbi:MAG: ankyrin repeat domain-containing protein [Planctomycetes bacterium]|nr:ankyrin repeat domain-containing protein [Planctomycetota bacterium]
MSRFLPLRANLEWLKKAAKDRLQQMQRDGSDARLHTAQLELARDYGFANWAAMVQHVETVRAQLHQAFPVLRNAPFPAEEVAADDADLIKLLGAVRAGETTVVMQILQARPALANVYGPAGLAPLHLAAQCNDARLAIVLLAYQADPLALIRGSGHDALSWAATCNAPDFARALIRLAVPPDLFAAAGLGLLPEVQACFDDLGELLPQASRTGSSRYAPDGSRLPCPPSRPVEQISDALAFAARNGHVEVVRFLLTRPIDLAFRAFLGATPLHWAVFSGCPATVALLRDAGADSALLDETLQCPAELFGICAAASWGWLVKVKALLDAEPQLLRAGQGQTSALHEAAAGGHLAVVCDLLDRGADPDMRDRRGLTPRERALEKGHTAVAAIFPV